MTVVAQPDPQGRAECQQDTCKQLGVGNQVEGEHVHRKADIASKGPAVSKKWRHQPSTWRTQILGFTVVLQWADGAHYAQFRYPRWMASFLWDLRVARASSGWTMAVSSCNVRARDSGPFVYIRDGNLNGLLE